MSRTIVKFCWFITVLLFGSMLMLSSISYCEDDNFSQNLNKAKKEVGNIKQQFYSRWLSSKENIENNLQKPLISNVPLYSLDRSESGNAQLICPGQQTAMEILTQPSGSGDLNFIQVVYDLNLDGNFDGSLYISGPISGVCANGFIKCNAGTWNNCHYYRWRYSNGSLGYEEVPVTALGGCYCINRSCVSTPILSYKDIVLNSIGGGIAAVLSEANPGFGISSGQIDGFYIRYFAQNAGKCDLSAAGNLTRYGFSSPEEVNPAQLEVLTEQEVEAQNTDQDSPYYLLTHSTAQLQEEKRECEKRRVVNFDSSSCRFVNTTVNGCASLERDENCVLEYEEVYDLYGNSVVTYRNFNPTGLFLLGKTCKEFDRTQFVNCLLNCNENFSSYGTTDGGCPVGVGPGKICYAGHIASWDFISDNEIAVHLSLTRRVNCVREVDYDVCGKTVINYKTSDDPCIVIKVNNQTKFSYCDHTSSDETPYSKEWEYNSGSNRVRVFAHCDDAGSCNTSPSLGMTVYLKFNPVVSKVCYNWWRIKRIYVCKTEELKPDMTRIKHIDQTFQETSYGATYEDMIQKNGVWITLSNQRVELYRPEGDESCIKACKIRKFVIPAQSSASGTEKDFRDPGHVVITYRTCIGDSCPVNTGEGILEGCKCIRNFNESISVLQALRMSAMDMTCTDGVQKE